jgi:hypothetical protein
MNRYGVEECDIILLGLFELCSDAIVMLQGLSHYKPDQFFILALDILDNIDNKLNDMDITIPLEEVQNYLRKSITKIGSTYSVTLHERIDKMQQSDNC